MVLTPSLVLRQNPRMRLRPGIPHHHAASHHRIPPGPSQAIRQDLRAIPGPPLGLVRDNLHHPRLLRTSASEGLCRRTVRSGPSAKCNMEEIPPVTVLDKPLRRPRRTGVHFNFQSREESAIIRYFNYNRESLSAMGTPERRCIQDSGW